jgi:hypothetical protein
MRLIQIGSPNGASRTMAYVEDFHPFVLFDYLENYPVNMRFATVEKMPQL